MSGSGSVRREPWLLGAMLLLLLLLWLGYAWHRDAGFAGGPVGTFVGLLGTLLMLVPLVYTVVKRVPVLRRSPLQRWMQWHAYAGVLGAVLGVLHSGHRFDSWIGQLLIAAALLSVLTGYVGRHLTAFVVNDLRERNTQLVEVQAAWNRNVESLRAAGAWSLSRPPVPAGATSRAGVEVELDRLAGALADARYIVRSAQQLRGALRRWLAAHIVASVVFYAALAVHLWSAWAHGLRWWP